jgi:hypothetical protein
VAVKQLFHRYEKWEDWQAGMWQTIGWAEESAMLQRAFEFTGDHELYGSYMRRVASEWPIACKQNLTSPSTNKGAWIGHAAACMAIGAPEYITRRAWWKLTQEQRDLADEQAALTIQEWNEKQNPQLCIELETQGL